ncbi:MAG: hypothetical protein GF331_13940 [Chitinivibrionales bacterium]|nr:hypothetical protein [Chitinivibrionales bacterium]
MMTPAFDPDTERIDISSRSITIAMPWANDAHARMVRETPGVVDVSLQPGFGLIAFVAPNHRADSVRREAVARLNLVPPWRPS